MAKQDKKQNVEEGNFNISHLSIIGVCAFLLIGIVVLKNGFTLHFKNQNFNTGNTITYESVREKVLALNAQLGQENENVLDEQALEAQTKAFSRVLGISTEKDQLVVPAEKLISADLLSQVKILEINVSGKEAVKRYLDDLEMAERGGRAFSVLVSFASPDSVDLQNASSGAMEVVSKLKAVKVPSELAQFHRYKILYYVAISKISNILATNSDDPILRDQAVLFFSLVDKISKQQQEIIDKYGLPQNE